LQVSGRSLCADLVDCAIPPEATKGVQLKSQNLLQLARHFCKTINASIQVNSDVSDLSPVSVATLDPGDTLHEFLDHHARADGVRLQDQSDGGILITRRSDERISTALVLGENILEAKGEFNHRNRFSEYHIIGHTLWAEPADDSANNNSLVLVTGMAGDSISRYRPTTIIADNMTPEQARRHAEFTRNVHYGRSRKATYIVGGWRHAGGLWRHNTNVLVKDPWMGFEGHDGGGEWLMVGTVEYVLDGEGERTELTVMPREAYDMEPLPDEDAAVW
ncbi:MAG: hypothetical protein OQL21_10115, partial [Gammaproteobacteria bacterium]|nr:hypothetical protein [Gammaproteobacteria bacterium]